MNYPFWDVPHLGSGWVIGIIAIFHIMISHFAVGGGLYLPLAERKALREANKDWLEAIHRHSRFFLILTAAFGVSSGVGIWFAIGLANPEATSTLIHNFVFAWAIEWCCFLVEITAAAVYYYTWGRVPDRTHLRIGWVYAASSWLTLAVINGILTFMLTPGEAWLGVAGTGQEAAAFWPALFNPTYWPSLLLRTLVCFALAGVWALVTASRIDGHRQPELKTSIVRWSVGWLIPAFFLIPFVMLWYVAMVPASRQALLSLGIATIGQGTFTQVTRAALVTVMTSATILAIAYLLAWRNPREFNFGHAVAVLLLALAATGFTEQAREMLRKPFVVADHMFSNGVRRSDLARFNQAGYLTASPWLDSAATTDTAHRRRGELMLRGQCLACHTLDGYRPLDRLLAGRDRASIGSFLAILHDYREDSPYRAFMPPLAGTAAEVAALRDHLDRLVNGATAPKSGG